MSDRIGVKISLTTVEAEILEECLRATSLTSADFFRLVVMEFATNRGIPADVPAKLRPYRSWKIVSRDAKVQWEKKLWRIG